MTCCEKWAKAITGTSLYHNNPHITDAAIVPELNGTFAVQGCCLACHVLTDIVYCPWCGTRVVAPKEG